MAISTGLVANVIGQAGGVTGELFGKKKGVFIKDHKTGNVLVTLDASMKENHNVQAPATMFPIESGENITDNTIIKPSKIEVHGIISDNPVSLLRSAVDTVASHFLPPTGIIAGAGAVALFSALMGSSSPSVANFKSLLEMIVNRTLVDVYTSLWTWNSMLLEQLIVPRDAQKSTSLEFTAHFIQVIVVTPQTVQTTKYDSAAVAADQANLSKQQAGDASGFLAGRTKAISNGRAVISKFGG